MTDFIITGIKHGLTGRTGGGTRFHGALRYRNGLIAEVGAVVPRRLLARSEADVRQ